MIWLRLAMFAPVVACAMAMSALAVSAAARVIVELSTDKHVVAFATHFRVLLVDLCLLCLGVVRLRISLDCICLFGGVAG